MGREIAQASFQGSHNKEHIEVVENLIGGVFINEEIFKSEPDGHKFHVGQQLRLVGLEDYPEFNGEVVKITSPREEGTHGRAYYFETDNIDLKKNLNWTYEYRLRLEEIEKGEK